jgi:transcription antitermination factor NusA-like protein
LVELGLPELTTEQIEILCQTAENAARKYIEAKIGLKMVDRVDIAVEAEGQKPVNLSVEINLILNDAAKDVDADALVKEAVAQAHLASENFLRKLL